MGREITEGCQPHILAKKSFSPHIIPRQKDLRKVYLQGKVWTKQKVWGFLLATRHHKIDRDTLKININYKIIKKLRYENNYLDLSK